MSEQIRLWAKTLIDGGLGEVPCASASQVLAILDGSDEGSNRRVEWAVDYHDGTGPRGGEKNDEDTARRWVTHWNKHRESEPPATLVSRTVTTTDWTPTPLARDEDRLRESVSGGEA